VRQLVESRNLVSFVVSTALGLYLFRGWPFPAETNVLQMILLQKPYLYYGMKYGFVAMLFTTPYITSSILFSFAYISPQWLIVPERGLFTGIAIFGAVGSGKTSGCIYPFAEQVLAYRADDAERRAAGLVLEVKGDFCHKVRGILKNHGRSEDYVEVSLASPYRYNPLHNDLEAYALAYGIASLLNNLFGRGKETFWQQAYTNLAKFIILLHKVLYDYVTDTGNPSDHANSLVVFPHRDKTPVQRWPSENAADL
jgi:hypothetical protein